MTYHDLPDDQELINFINAADSPPKIREIARAFGLAPSDRSALRRKLVELADTGALHETSALHQDNDTETHTASGIKIGQITSIDPDGFVTAQFLSEEDAHLPPIQVRQPQPRHEGRGLGRGRHDRNKRSPARQIRIGDHALIRVRSRKDGIISGDIMRILPKSQDKLYGRIYKRRGQWMLENAEKGANRPLQLYVSQDDDVAENLLVEATMLQRKARSEPSAKIKRIIGPANSPAALAHLAAVEFDLRVDFSQTLLDEASKALVPALGKRTDLRDVPLVTIDGADAKDFDDAVFAEPQKDGGWRLIVAIADVSAYVQTSSEMDIEAQRRGNSVYLPGTVIPMLPEALSNGVCSLKPHEPRACLAVEIEIDGAGKKQSHHFFRGLMQSAARLTYEAVQNVMDGMTDESDIGAPAGSLHHLAGAFHCLKSARDERGTLNLNIKERRVEIDDEGQIAAIILREQKPAHQLIEEFMILANVCAAETLESQRALCVYRNHDRPDPEKLEALHEITSALSLPFAKGQVIQPHLFNKLLDAVDGKPEQQMINETILRCQARASYEIQNIGHYGLSLVRYAHFTSPIRRYADLLVHRSLIEACNLGTEKLAETPDYYKQICAHISQTEVFAAKAERRTTDRLAALHFLDAEGQVFDVRITGVNKAGLFVQMQNGLAEGFIPRKSLPDDRYDITTGGMVLQGQYTGWKFALGDDLQAKLLEVAPASGGLLFSWQGGGNQDFTDKKRSKSKGYRGQSRRENKKSGSRRRKK